MEQNGKFQLERAVSLCLIKKQCRHYFNKSVFISRRTNSCTQNPHNLLGKNPYFIHKPPCSLVDYILMLTYQVQSVIKSRITGTCNQFFGTFANILVSNFSSSMQYFTAFLIRQNCVHLKLIEHTAETLRKNSVRAEGSELIVIIIYSMENLIDFVSSF